MTVRPVLLGILASSILLLSITSSIDAVVELDCSELPSPNATEQTIKAKMAASILVSLNRRLNTRELSLRHHRVVFLFAVSVACLFLAINLVHLAALGHSKIRFILPKYIKRLGNATREKRG